MCVQGCTDPVAEIKDSGVWCAGFRMVNVSQQSLEARCFSRCSAHHACTMAMHTSGQWGYGEGNGLCFLFDVRSSTKKVIGSNLPPASINSSHLYSGSNKSSTCYVKSLGIQCVVSEVQSLPYIGRSYYAAMQPHRETEHKGECVKTRLLKEVCDTSLYREPGQRSVPKQFLCS